MSFIASDAIFLTMTHSQLSNRQSVFLTTSRSSSGDHDALGSKR